MAVCLLLSLPAMAQSSQGKPKRGGETTKTMQTSKTAKPAKPAKTSKASNAAKRKGPANVVENGHEAVDMGLSVKWATCNIGAFSPSEFGDYLAWGELATKPTYTEENSETYKKAIGNITGNPQYDAARAKWGGNWRMPTAEEFQELIDGCIWEKRHTLDNVYKFIGYQVTSKSNGNSIFLPAGGIFKTQIELYSLHSGHYWSGSSKSDPGLAAKEFYFDSHNKIRISWASRDLGLSIRPVIEQEQTDK